jgi:thymidylate synthase
MNDNFEKQYLELLQNILDDGNKKEDRTGVGTTSIFGAFIKHDMRKGFPIITTKKSAFKTFVAETLWFLKGSTNVNELRALIHGEENRFNDNKKTVWDANYEQQGIAERGYSYGYTGPIYGKQWRDFNESGLDQIKYIIDEAMENPGSRRLLVTSWNPLQINEMILPPCHSFFQINIEDEYIDLQWYQRSSDLFLGAPANVLNYSILLYILGRILNKTPRYLSMSIGDAHIYNNHIEQVTELLSRKPYSTENTTLQINPKLKTLEDFENATIDDFIIVNYRHRPALKAPMAV